MTTTPRKTGSTRRPAKSAYRRELDAQLAHAKAWLKASTDNDEPDVHQAQQRVDELTAQIADADQ